MPRSVVRTKNFLGKSNWADAMYRGILDDARIYQRALSQAEILELIAGRVDADLLVGYALDETTGTIAHSVELRGQPDFDSPLNSSPLISTSATLPPCCAILTAAECPDGPPPIMTALYFFIIYTQHIPCIFILLYINMWIFFVLFSGYIQNYMNRVLFR